MFAVSSAEQHETDTSTHAIFTNQLGQRVLRATGAEGAGLVWSLQVGFLFFRATNHLSQAEFWISMLSVAITLWRMNQNRSPFKDAVSHYTAASHFWVVCSCIRVGSNCLQNSEFASSTWTTVGKSITKETSSSTVYLNSSVGIVVRKGEVLIWENGNLQQWNQLQQKRQIWGVVGARLGTGDVCGSNQGIWFSVTECWCPRRRTSCFRLVDPKGDIDGVALRLPEIQVQFENWWLSNLFGSFFRCFFVKMGVGFHVLCPIVLDCVKSTSSTNCLAQREFVVREYASGIFLLRKGDTPWENGEMWKCGSLERVFQGKKCWMCWWRTLQQNLQR